MLRVALLITLVAVSAADDDCSCCSWALLRRGKSLEDGSVLPPVYDPEHDKFGEVNSRAGQGLSLKSSWRGTPSPKKGESQARQGKVNSEEDETDVTPAPDSWGHDEELARAGQGLSLKSSWRGTPSPKKGESQARQGKVNSEEDETPEPTPDPEHDKFGEVNSRAGQGLSLKSSWRGTPSPKKGESQ